MSATKVPKCNYKKDCFMCSGSGHCYLLNNTEFKDNKCPFYRNKASVKPFRPIRSA